MKLRTIMFDLGNVIIYFDNKKMHAQLGKVVGIEASLIHKLISQDGIQNEYEKGHVATAEMIAFFRSHAKRDFVDEELVTAFCDIFTLNQELVAILPQLKDQGLRLVIVSNTNTAHMEWEKKNHDFFKFFDHEIFSHEINAMKPDEAFYSAAALVSHCELNEVLFVDDLHENCEGAARFGFHTHHFRGIANLRNDFVKFGIQA